MEQFELNSWQQIWFISRTGLNQKCERGLRLNLKKHKLAIFHHNVQNLLPVTSPLK
jgi:hypothetical protein